MDNIKEIKTLRCIEYPGIVKNVDNMLKTLGGINKISEIFLTDKRRLELRFHPDNIYSKPAFSDQVQSTGILLKFRFRKIKQNKSESPPEKILHTVTYLGMIDSIYKFESLCDFQYLPIQRSLTTANGEDHTEMIYHECMPPDVVNIDWLTTDSKNVQYFLPPATFTRIDNINTNLFKKEFANKDNQQQQLQQQQQTQSTLSSLLDDDQQSTMDSLIKPKILPRHKHASYLTFNLNPRVPIPNEPSPHALETLKLKFISDVDYERVKELFVKRPLWTKTAIAYETRIPSEKLKYILPSVSYYYTTGPWRIIWVRYGYDPRKEFESRYYQHLDYRIRAFNGLQSFVDLTKRSKPNISTKMIRATAPFQLAPGGSSTPAAAGNDGNTLRKNKQFVNPYFEIDYLPKARQFFFQYCDIHVPKIQEMLNNIPTPLSGATCNEKTGWLPFGFDDQCREILNIVIRENRIAAAKYNNNGNNDGKNATATQNESQNSEIEFGVDDEEGDEGEREDDDDEGEYEEDDNEDDDDNAIMDTDYVDDDNHNKNDDVLSITK